jgi:hypothetical protein
MTGQTAGIKFDRAAAVIGLIVALALLPVQLFIDHIYAQTLPPVLALACLIYLAAGDGENERDILTMPTWLAHLFPSLVVFGASGLVVLAHVQGGRTQLFLVLAALLGTLVLGQLLFARDEDINRRLLLFQIFVLGAVVRYAAVFTTPGFIGIDVWLHMEGFARGVLEAGAVSGMGETKYVMAPLYHLLVVTTSLFTGLSLRYALFLSLGLAMPVAILFVYAASRYLVPTRWALFAAALFAIAGAAIQWSIHLIPTSLGLLYFVAVLALVMRLFLTPTRTRDSVLLIIFFMAMALTHQVSSFILMVFLLVGVFTQFVLKSSIMNAPDSSRHGLGAKEVESVPFTGYVVFNAGFLTLTWSLTPYYGRSFIETAAIFMLDSLGGSFQGGGGLESGGGGQSIPLAQFIISNFDVLGFLLFLFGTAVGSLYALRRGRTNQAVLTLVVAAVVMTAFTLGPPLVGIGTFLSGRWFAFLYAVMAVLVAIGFSHLRRGLSPTLLVVFLLVFLYAGPMMLLASPKGTVDQPVLEHQRPRLGYTEEELAAVYTVGSVTTGSPNDPIFTDFPYTSVYNRVYSTRFGVARVPDGQAVNESEVIYREYQTEGAPLFEGGTGGQRVHRVRKAALCPPERDIVYSNGQVTFCRAA